MESNKILNADLLDILFEGKNKEYGAYELRKTYNKRITIAIISIAFICEPAIQNDRKVIYQAIPYITFQVAED